MTPVLPGRLRQVPLGTCRADRIPVSIFPRRNSRSHVDDYIGALPVRKVENAALGNLVEPDTEDVDLQYVFRQQAGFQKCKYRFQRHKLRCNEALPLLRSDGFSALFLGTSYARHWPLSWKPASSYVEN